MTSSSAPLITTHSLCCYSRRLLGSAAACCALAVSAAAASSLSLVEVAPGVLVHHGAQQETSAANRGDIANIGFIVGASCVAVIDTGGSPAIGAALREAIREYTPLPVCYVINTHVHPDHILGNAAFMADHPVYIAHARLPQALAQRWPYYRQTLSRAFGETPPDTWVVMPTEVVAHSRTLDLGDRTLQLTAYPTAHTNNDLTVYDAQTGTLWLSDLLFVERVPSLDGSVRGWLSVLETLSEQRAQRAVPGHGPVSVPWPQAAAAEQRYLETLARETRAALARGDTLQQAMDQVGGAERGRWLLFDEYHRRNVSVAYGELEWE